MQVADPVAEGERVMRVCNACRYCEQYCPAFEAMEQRLTFGSAELNYLANLCHNCGECLYACQYAPPHEFAINVPRTLARIRVRAYEEYAWPSRLKRSFEHHTVPAALLLAAALVAAMLASAAILDPGALWASGGRADFYAVVPHAAMVALFGSAGLFALVALWIGSRRCQRDIERARPVMVASKRAGGGTFRALHDALTLRHLQTSGENCTTSENLRTPWRRWFHHATSYGFALCFASTSVAAIYHGLGRPAPYAYTSLPVLLGVAGGVGLLVGPAGLLHQRRRRDAELSDSSQERLDRAFIVSLLLTGATGLLLLALRHQPVMGVLLIVHLGVVLALFLTLPYGKFVHGFYRVAALVEHARHEATR